VRAEPPHFYRTGFKSGPVRCTDRTVSCCHDVTRCRWYAKGRVGGSAADFWQRRRRRRQNSVRPRTTLPAV